MKNPNLSFPVVFLSIVLAVVLAPSTVSSSIVLDTVGRPVRPGVPYYILPAEDGTGAGGLVPATAYYQRDACPPAVVQSQLPYVLGVPVTFAPVNSEAGFVPTSSDLTVEFDSDVWICPESKVWKTDYAQLLRTSYVSAGGDKSDGDSWFKIEQDGDDYKIFHSLSSSYVSISNPDRGVRGVLVGPSGRLPFLVKFKRAYETTNELLKNTM
ncbi:PREDICTED: bark lectin-like [Tarenaya hassleriana]|uniref:bark lectin-like n=1 Tax=Tarenaya hassleriana TaxID=28532 RepID=UPI00053C6BE8|nr:PREDICTED: bark lectin-like [Tarenaya hassleriana]